MSLSGRAAVNQYSGVVIATATAATDQRLDAIVPSSRRNSAAIARTPRAPATTLTSAERSGLRRRRGAARPWRSG